MISEGRFFGLESIVLWLRDALMKVVYAAPKKYKRGTLAYADGTSWNPGSGEGLYQYDGSNWRLLWSPWSVDGARITARAPVALNPPASVSVGTGQAVMYFRNGKFVIAFDDAGTVRYKYLDLTGTGTTWQHTTTQP